MAYSVAQARRVLFRLLRWPLTVILVLDFGGQYNQLIARRVRECGVYSEIRMYDSVSIEEILRFDPRGIIFTGGPQSAYAKGAPSVDDQIFSLEIPILGICYGAQLMAYKLGGKIGASVSGEYGHTEVEVTDRSGLLRVADEKNICWMSHTDYISEVPEGFHITAHTDSCPVAARSLKQCLSGIGIQCIILIHTEGLQSMHHTVKNRFPGREIIAQLLLTHQSHCDSGYEDQDKDIQG